MCVDIENNTIDNDIANEAEKNGFPAGTQNTPSDTDSEIEEDEQELQQQRSTKRKRPHQEIPDNEQTLAQTRRLVHELTDHQLLCSMLRPIAGERGKRLQNLITWLMYVMLFWQVTNHISNRAMVEMLAFMGQVLSVAANPQLGPIAKCVPRSILRLKNWLGVRDIEYIEMAVCPKCNKLYENDARQLLYTDRHGRKHVKSCKGVDFDYKVCNTAVFTKVKVGRELKHVAVAKYCYKTLASSLEDLLLRPGFERDCKLWKERRTLDGVYSDIYDGNVWKEFVAKGFLNNDDNLALQLNVDWFQKFKRRNNISIGVVYVTVLNLPRSLRYKLKNVIVFGIIPNLEHEPPLDEYFEPLVAELLEFWNTGKMLRTFRCPEGKKVRCALINVAADLPAARKCVGVVG